MEAIIIKPFALTITLKGIKGASLLKKRLNLFYIFLEDCRKNPMRKEARERISKILALFFAKEKADANFVDRKEENE